jgi:hypothetical protein
MPRIVFGHWGLRASCASMVSSPSSSARSLCAQSYSTRVRGVRQYGSILGCPIRYYSYILECRERPTEQHTRAISIYRAKPEPEPGPRYLWDEYGGHNRDRHVHYRRYSSGNSDYCWDTRI